MCFIASWFPVHLLLLDSIPNIPWGCREDSWFPWALKRNTIWGVRINSSENLELLKQSYIWIISSRIVFFPLQSYLVMEKPILTLDSYKNRQMPLPLPSPAWSKQLPHTGKEWSWTCVSSSSWELHGQSSRGKGNSKVSGTRGLVKDPKSQQDLKKVQDYAFANPTARFRTHSSLKGNIYKQHSAGEK